MTKRYLAYALVVATTTLASTLTGLSAEAAGRHGQGHGPAMMGSPGKAADVSRTVEVVMYDNRYEPSEISAKEGETVRFVIRNAGEFVHEFNIGTREMHRAHQPEMMRMMERGVLEADRIHWDAMKRMHDSMWHEEPNSILLEPGQSGELFWKFPDHAELEFACNVPGHYESGMHGPFKLVQ